MAFDAQRLDQQLCFALYRASRALIRSYDPLLKPLGITYPQYLALLVLWEVEKPTVRELGAKLALDSATLTPLLKRLEAQGLVTRERDPEDERQVRIGLTTKGAGLKQKAKKIPLELACRWGFDPAETANLQRLVKLREQLNALTATLGDAA